MAVTPNGSSGTGGIGSWVSQAASPLVAVVCGLGILTSVCRTLLARSSRRACVTSLVGTSGSTGPCAPRGSFTSASSAVASTRRGLCGSGLAVPLPALARGGRSRTSRCPLRPSSTFGRASRSQRCSRAQTRRWPAWLAGAGATVVVGSAEAACTCSVRAPATSASTPAWNGWQTRRSALTSASRPPPQSLQPPPLAKLQAKVGGSCTAPQTRRSVWTAGTTRTS
mmetsp:Transcript_17666/g.53359  ORF Transcript_17666/g.53359 Transcript_17666/m.53359 type:complete len:225 (+) Transcript_17666:45-719(+)